MWLLKKKKKKKKKKNYRPLSSIKTTGQLYKEKRGEKIQNTHMAIIISLLVYYSEGMYMTLHNIDLGDDLLLSQYGQ